MPWNLLLLPLIGGFWFITLYYPSRFQSIQLSRERLIFFSATAAVGLAIIAQLMVMAAARHLPGAIDWITLNYIPWPYAGTAFLAFLLGPMIAYLLNFFVHKSTANFNSIFRYGDQLERTLLIAQENNDLVVIFLKSGKVYVGLVVQLPANLEGRNPWLTIVPYFSGYRDPQTKKMRLTTNYVDIIEKYFGNSEDTGEPMNIAEEMFNRTIRTDDIEICGIFDPEVWESFQSAPSVVENSA